MLTSLASCSFPDSHQCYITNDEDTKLAGPCGLNQGTMGTLYGNLVARDDFNQELEQVRTSILRHLLPCDSDKSKTKSFVVMRKTLLYISTKNQTPSSQ